MSFLRLWCRVVRDRMRWGVWFLLGLVWGGCEPQSMSPQAQRGRQQRPLTPAEKRQEIERSARQKMRVLSLRIARWQGRLPDTNAAQQERKRHLLQPIEEQRLLVEGLIKRLPSVQDGDLPAFAKELHRALASLQSRFNQATLVTRGQIPPLPANARKPPSGRLTSPFPPSAFRPPAFRPPAETKPPSRQAEVPQPSQAEGQPKPASRQAEVPQPSQTSVPQPSQAVVRPKPASPASKPAALAVPPPNPASSAPASRPSSLPLAR